MAGAQQFVPAAADIAGLRAAAADCRGCDLFRDTTQTVFGRGDESARIVLVGEQPGDVEDRKGLPFVGPAGHLLRRAVDDAGLHPGELYITNAVKHFKHRATGPGKRRIHQTPTRVEVQACRPWLVAEFSRLRPAAVVALGATAAQALLGPDFRITRSRGKVFDWPASAEVPAEFPAHDHAFVVATAHPSAVLRADNREIAYAALVDDLRVVKRELDLA
ncbi:UdgX family uracil-DNA binding protein [Natronosporangium hydrolyticum]|uniref:Type-4 uracil-DNA glycosylase n=1 Tax=Natronosporangium hydrolyticum TaxID=2811111 RepID=A0A895YHT7_9ACTN|nr:UdgX family uracil-DNA binding protein [Natronosporangium hydrolyticum]QSB17407.1 UdgX family uracil-DNA binding protein [Natronosporangium hydrolyticum]